MIILPNEERNVVNALNSVIEHMYLFMSYLHFLPRSSFTEEENLE